jgi:hypothetical protein
MHQLLIWLVNDLEGRCGSLVSYGSPVFVGRDCVKPRKLCRKPCVPVEIRTWHLLIISRNRYYLRKLAWCCCPVVWGNLRYGFQIARVYGANLEPFNQQSSWFKQGGACLAYFCAMSLMYASLIVPHSANWYCIVYDIVLGLASAR